ncbi:MAG: IPTL-CTERM sorting domain-containing protein [Pseudomonadota bacterium]
MKVVEKVAAAAVLLVASQAQAGVDVTGFTIESASRPYGLIVMALLIVGFGLASLRRS